MLYLICPPSALGPAALVLRVYISGRALVPVLQLLNIICPLISWKSCTNNLHTCSHTTNVHTADTCTHACTHTHAHTHTNEHIHTHTRAHTHTHMHTYTHACMHTHAHTHTNEHTHTRTHTHMHKFSWNSFYAVI